MFSLKRALKGRSAHVERLAGYVRVSFALGIGQAFVAV